MYQNNLPPGALIIDVREKEEYARHHMNRAINIPVYLLEKELPRICDDFYRPIYLYCDHGAKSKAGKVLLMDLGYRDVHDMGSLLPHRHY